MANELKLTNPDIEYTTGIVKFENFEVYKEQAQTIADFIKTHEVTEENIKETKKMLAASRKVVDELNRKRIDIKKELLKSYESFEAQIKELKAIVDEADKEVRSQVKELEEKERQAKKEKIFELWNNRIQQYDIDFIPDLFDRWLTESHLNKSTPMTKVELDMVGFMEKVQQDLEAIETFEEKTELLADYIETLSLTESLANLRAREEREQIVKEAIGGQAEEKAVFIVTGKKDIAMADMLLRMNDINFERK